jgi:hypothetical protein
MLDLEVADLELMRKNALARSGEKTGGKDRQAKLAGNDSARAGDGKMEHDGSVKKGRAVSWDAKDSSLGW